MLISVPLFRGDPSYQSGFPLPSTQYLFTWSHWLLTLPAIICWETGLRAWGQGLEGKTPGLKGMKHRDEGFCPVTVYIINNWMILMYTLSETYSTLHFLGNLLFVTSKKISMMWKRVWKGFKFIWGSFSGVGLCLDWKSWIVKSDFW